MAMKVWSKPAKSHRWLIGFGLLAAVSGSLVTYAVLPTRNETLVTESTAAAPLPPTVVALGRLEPVSTVINLSTPLALEGDRIAELLVAAGDIVEAGQVVAIMDSRDRLQQLMAQAEAQKQAAEQRLALVQAGEKQGILTAQQADIAQLEADLAGVTSAQSATLTRLRAELSNAQVEFERFEQLYRQGAVSASVRDEKQTALTAAQAQVEEATAELERSQQTLQAQIASAKANLSQLREIRPEDIAVAQAEVSSAAEALTIAKTELSKSQVRAPIAGQVLKIHSYPGEKVSEQGIVELGQTQRMIVVAEVDESNIQQVQVGQKAVITADALPRDLTGTVAQIGQSVGRQSVFSNQPGSNLDSRVVEVRIALTTEDSSKVASLTNLQVETAIQTHEAI